MGFDCQGDACRRGGVKERPERQLDVSVCQWELSERTAHHQTCAHLHCGEDTRAPLRRAALIYVLFSESK